ncbi:hypothetical protein KAFR_0G00190 [Kazachstania africana CBS 2517]|uniref:Uncharacterized protein n=1 Tax=Kazachstania africana (strain ATCC 22294 / BCRC 22015 / CBS 2517 / CECT 1963 / NBRC 1671 / NRRL Y-8276) TaxID=1071382 RepID=H2AXF2_KAZAF|nr:hypothetical protein KAFR_0G00190 [Kazachstania africana CBS 2517]CCF59052.1 hypothetical protein KAFR_0G00190 [Kazachstania africana CBS 2517]
MRQEIVLESTGENANKSIHLIPARVKYTGPTTEFEDNFKNDPNESESHVRYLRGKKLLGTDILSSIPGRKGYIIEKKNGKADEGQEQEKEAYITSGPLTSVINYEREGNEKRSEDEVSKFQEYISLIDIIHG